MEIELNSITETGLGTAAVLMRRHSLYQPCSVTSSSSSSSSTGSCLTSPRARSRSHSTSSVSTTPNMLTEKIECTLYPSDSTIDIDDPSPTHAFLQYVDDQVHETWDTAKLAVIGAQRLLCYHELPKEWQENEYVLTGYRFYETHRDCLRSIFMLHNETLNIWSHLLGFIFFSYFSVSTFIHHFPEASISDRTIFATFCLAALKCLFCSSLYHTYICHSKHKTFAATLDYIGIAFLIAASVLVTEFYGFYCRPVARTRYMIFTGIVSSFGVILPFNRRWDTKAFRPIRISVFLALAFSSVVPVVHLILLNGFWPTLKFLQWLMVSVSMYILGVIFYANRFPEKFYPGRFDFAGMTSHAIWHVFVCFGIYFHYIASLHFYKHREEFGCATYSL